MSTPITVEQLLEIVEASMKKLEVCVPSRDFYRRKDEWTDETIMYVCADTMREKLKELQE